MSGPRKVTVDRLTLRLPPGPRAEARAIAREVGRALEGLPVEGATAARRVEASLGGRLMARGVGRRVAKVARRSLKRAGDLGDGG